MILTPNAKPVRIRILSGGEEHSSLESLRNNFSLKDLIPTVNDGRLAKWLRQKGEDALADEVSFFHFNTNLIQPDRNEVLNFILLFFPSLRNLSLEDIINVWRKEKIKNFQYLVELVEFAPTLDEAIKWFGESYTSTPRSEKWCSWFITRLRQVGLQTAVDIYVEGKLDGLLTHRDWFKVFSNRRDYANATMFYEVGKRLAKMPKYNDIAIDYLKKSADLGYLDAKKYLIDEIKVMIPYAKIEKWAETKEKIEQFLRDPLVFKKMEKRGSDLDHFLKVLAVSLDQDGAVSITDTIRKNDNPTYYKYLEVIEILRRYYRIYKERINPEGTLKALEALRKPDFPAFPKIYYAFKNNEYMGGGISFRDLRYKDHVRYVVQLIKGFEF